MSEIAALNQRLQHLHQRTVETPLFNPVFQLGLELSRRLEAGETTLDDLETLVAELEAEGAKGTKGLAIAARGHPSAARGGVT